MDKIYAKYIYKKWSDVIVKKIHYECSCPQGAIPFAVCLGFSSDCCLQSFVTTFKRLNNKLRESLHTNRASFAIALGKSVAADLLRFADKSAHQVRSSTSVVSHDMRVRVSLSAPSKATNEKFVAFYFWKIWTSSSARTEKTHGSADDFNQSQLLILSNRSWEISCSWPTKIRRQVGSSS